MTEDVMDLELTIRQCLLGEKEFKGFPSTCSSISKKVQPGTTPSTKFILGVLVIICYHRFRHCIQRILFVESHKPLFFLVFSCFFLFFLLQIINTRKRTIAVKCYASVRSIPQRRRKVTIFNSKSNF